MSVFNALTLVVAVHLNTWDLFNRYSEPGRGRGIVFLASLRRELRHVIVPDVRCEAELSERCGGTILVASLLRGLRCVFAPEIYDAIEPVRTRMGTDIDGILSIVRKCPSLGIQRGDVGPPTDR